MRVAGGQQELEGLPRLEAIRDRHRHLSRRRFHLQALTTAHACRNSDLHLLSLLSQGLRRRQPPRNPETNRGARMLLVRPHLYTHAVALHDLVPYFPHHFCPMLRARNLCTTIKTHGKEQRQVCEG